MKKTISLMIFVLLLPILASGCYTSGSDPQIQYGTYTIDRVVHLPLFSSTTPDYFLDMNIGTSFTVSKDNFSIDTSGASAPSAKNVKFENVSLVREDLGTQLLTMEEAPGAIDLTSYKQASGYEVISNSSDTGFRIYYMDDEIWIGHFSWYGEKKDAWWADYIFGVVPN